MENEELKLYSYFLSRMAEVAASGKPILSVVVPVFNEEEVVEQFVETVSPFILFALKAHELPPVYEILFIDDGSRDSTCAQIRRLMDDHPQIKLLELSRNFGKDAALSAGLSRARGAAVVPMDVDLQDPPEVLAKMIDAWVNGAQVVNAVRVDRNSDGWLKKSSANLFYKLYNLIADTRIADNVGDFRLLDRQVVDTVNRLDERNRFMKGLFSWVGYRTADVPYVRPERVAGTTKWRYWKLWNFALDGITGSSTVLLRIWTYIGLLVAVLAIGMAVYIIIRTMVHGADTPGYASLMVVLLSLNSLILISMGILGEYLGRISIEVRRRPVYIINETEDTPS